MIIFECKEESKSPERVAKHISGPQTKGGYSSNGPQPKYTHPYPRSSPR
jgi:hypothetical protein